MSNYRGRPNRPAEVVDTDSVLRVTQRNLETLEEVQTIKYGKNQRATRRERSQRDKARYNDE